MTSPESEGSPRTLSDSTFTLAGAEGSKRACDAASPLDLTAGFLTAFFLGLTGVGLADSGVASAGAGAKVGAGAAGAVTPNGATRLVSCARTTPAPSDATRVKSQAFVFIILKLKI